MVAVEELDVCIVGAGISGIGVAHHLQAANPDRSWAILEARDAIGGTWDLFRYPGIRSDSDLQTFGYAFQPWTGDRAIADGPSILAYLHETAAEHGIDRRIRLHHRVVTADFHRDRERWELTVDRTDPATGTSERVTVLARWLVSAAGYYRYDRGHRPPLPGEDAFAGTFVHPQQWPDDLDLADQRVVVVGSGATAVTLVPAIAEAAAHVTLLQRTPSYVLPMPSVDGFANAARRWLGDERGHALARRKNLAQEMAIYRACRRWPTAMRRVIRWLNARELPDHVDVDVHFNPPYDPWDQRLCVAPDGDLFRVLSDGSASIVTDEITGFTADGVELASGDHLPADVVVTATGLELQVFGGMDVCVDGAPVVAADTLAFRGMLLSGVPNFAFVTGYTNASWTLKVDLVGAHLARLLAHMDAQGHTTCEPVDPGPSVGREPLLDFRPGYVRRSLHLLPRRGDRPPWEVVMDVHHDERVLRDGPVTDPELALA